MSTHYPIAAFVYLSKASHCFSTEQLDELIQQAAEQNGRFGITGFLHYCADNQRFLQYIEGDSKPLSQLIQNIHADKRHQLIRSLNDESVPVHRFRDWKMKRINTAKMRFVGLERILTDVMQLEVPSTERQHFMRDPIWGIVNSIAQLESSRLKLNEPL